MEFNKLNSKIFFFPPEKEIKFRTSYLDRTLVYNRIALFLGILIYGSFGLLDLAVSPELKYQFWTIRYGIVIPFAIAVLIFSFHIKIQKFIQPMLYVAIVVSSVGILKMMGLAKPPINYLYYAGLMLISIYLYTFLRIRFFWAVLSGITILIAYELYSIMIYDDSKMIIISNNFFFITANLMGMVSNYTIEYYIRKEFLKSDILFEEKEKVSQANLLLENRVNERTKELSLAKALAEKSEKLKTEFLAQISHEIRSPLNTILNFSSLIKNEYNLLSQNEIEECYSGISFAGQRIVRTIDLILNMSEIQINSYEYKSKKIDLSKDVLKKLTRELKFSASSKGVDLLYIDSCENSDLIADEYTIYQIFDNLINNAIKYTTEGEIRVVLSETSENKLLVEVIDTGIGISEEYLPNLFSPFTQEEMGYARKYDGNGLGLALVKNYCDLNNATILVESKKGTGSKFSVIFDKQ